VSRAASSYGASLRLLLSINWGQPKEGRNAPCVRQRHCISKTRTGTCTRHCFPSLSVWGELDDGLDSRPVIKWLFRGFLNRISISARPFRRCGKRRKAASCSVRKYRISRLNGRPIYIVACRRFSFPTRLHAQETMSSTNDEYINTCSPLRQASENMNSSSTRRFLTVQGIRWIRARHRRANCSLRIIICYNVYNGRASESL